MSFNQLVASAQRFYAQLLTSSCTITRFSSALPVTDAITGVVTMPDVSTVYSGACRHRTLSTVDSVVDAGEQHLTMQRRIVKVPMTVSVKIGDVVHITDGSLPDVSYKVCVINKPTHAVVITLIVEELEVKTHV